MDTIENQVKFQILDLKNKQQIPVAVLLGHEDWLYFAEQSQVAYTPFGSARRYQPALQGLLLVRVDEINLTKVVTQVELEQLKQQYRFVS
jgi:hypothetical protein